MEKWEKLTSDSQDGLCSQWQLFDYRRNRVRAMMCCAPDFLSCLQDFALSIESATLHLVNFG